MRVNVYGEELTDRIEVVTKEVECDACQGLGRTPEDHGTGYVEYLGCQDCQAQGQFTFYGIRFWLKFPNQDWWVHRKVDGEEDDDSSAITIWSDSREKLATALQHGLDELVGY